MKKKLRNIEEQAHLATAKFNPQTGQPLTDSEKAARPNYPFVQKLLYIQPVSQERLAKAQGRHRVKLEDISYPYKEMPLKLYSLIANNKPELPIFPQHGVNCYVEDFVHDWTIKNGNLDYCSRYFHEGGVWVLLEFEKEPTLA